MKIHKILNNNVAVILDENNKEEIVMGRGIVFKKRIGDLIDNNSIDKRFKLADQNLNTMFQELLINIPLEYVELAESIIAYAKTKIGKKLNNSIYITLSDHLYAACQRALDGICLKNKMYWETKRFYPDEFSIGLEALKFIKNKTNIQLSQDEASFIAFHFVNAQLNEFNQTVNDVTKVMLEIENVVKYTFGVTFNEDSVYYYRFITHLKFFASRLFSNKTYISDDNDGLLEIIKMKYVEPHKCVLKIVKFIKDKYGYELSGDEILYLTIHIAKIVSESN